MTDDSFVVRKGLFKGKRVELASTTGIQTFEEIAEDFMHTLFGFDPGQYLITDLSSLHDLVGVDDMEVGDMLTSDELVPNGAGLVHRTRFELAVCGKSLFSVEVRFPPGRTPHASIDGARREPIA